MTRRSGVPRKSLGIERLANLLCGMALAGASGKRLEGRVKVVFSVQFQQ